MSNDLDRMSNRVTLIGVVGGAAGALAATLQGHPVLRTAGLTALSCGMTASACLIPERLAAWTLFFYVWPKPTGPPVAPYAEGYSFWTRGNMLLVSHAIGGAVGGALVGTLYQGRASHGVAVCVPAMTLLGFLESMFQDMQDEAAERNRLVQQNQQLQQQPKEVAQQKEEQQQGVS